MVASLDPRIEQLLTEFGKTQKASDAEQSAMRRAIVESPYLAQLIETNLDRGVLKGFTARDTPGAGGHFSDHDGVLNVSRRTLKDAAKTPEGMDLLVGTLAHEAAHGANQQDRAFRLEQFERELGKRFATDSDVHDPTDLALTLQQRQRWDEAYAELHSVNAVISRIKHANPNASDEEVMSRVGGTSACAVLDPASQKWTWTEGIHIKADGRVAYTPDNIEAVAACHFDQPADKAKLGAHNNLDYRNYYAAHAMGRIADQKIEADNAITNPLAGPDPPLHLNLGRLGWDLEKIERDGVSFANHKVDLNFYDTTTGTPVMRNLRDTTTDARTVAPPDLAAPATPAQAAQPTKPDPRTPSHPDHALYLQAHKGVAELDASLGRAYDADSERLAASLTVLAKAQGLSRIDHVVLGNGGAVLRPGENIFVVEGRLDDPANRRAHMPTEQAAKAPVEASFDRLAEVNQVLEVERSQQQGREFQAPAQEGMRR
ncbi:XVIPCD domain-containing protein [Lysobacter capsici]|uniref:XVIPCD domain-containing protein n=1 Tax=Lysobacter capsici TaxID=435897 RepID=UPI000627D4CC|nr:XVIPCD domain-containing protein [Lysobacter capsici]